LLSPIIPTKKLFVAIISTYVNCATGLSRDVCSKEHGESAAEDMIERFETAIVFELPRLRKEVWRLFVRLAFEDVRVAGNASGAVGSKSTATTTKTS